MSIKKRKELLLNAIYSTEDVAEFLMVTPKTVEKLCREGKLKAKKLRKYKILGQSVFNFLNNEKNKIINPNQVYNAMEVAKILEVNPRTVVKLCKEGQIRSKKIKGYKILGLSLINYFYNEVMEEFNQQKNKIEIMEKKLKRYQGFAREKTKEKLEMIIREIVKEKNSN